MAQSQVFPRHSIQARKQNPAIFSTSAVIDWLLCFVSILCLIFVTRFGTLGALFFILPWIVIILTRPHLAFESVLRNAWLLTIPIFCVISTFWSEFPMETLKAALEFLITVLIAIWAGSCVRPRIFISALFVASVIVVALSAAIGKTGVDGGTGEVVLLGLFDSKNQLAFHSVVLLMTSVTIVLDRYQLRILRVLAIASARGAPAALLAAKSAGSLVFSFPGVLALLLIRSISTLPRLGRLVMFVLGFTLFLPTIMGASLFFDDYGAVLDALGKDSSLTGRTYLWEKAVDFINARPLLGIGYQAFWRVGYPPAEDLWRINQVESGAGFHFHNLYLNTGVELGIAGILLLIVLLLGIAIRVILAAIADPSLTQSFAAGIFVYFFMISSVEAFHLYPFYLGTVLLYMSWCYLKPGTPWRLEERQRERFRSKTSARLPA